MAFEIEDINRQKEDVEKSTKKSQVLLSKLDNEVKDSQDAVSEKRGEYKKLQTERDNTQKQLLELSKKLSDLDASLQMAEQSRQFDECD